ncbi:MAG: hypothetical protein ABJP33_16855 [Pseudoruegeria sp.]
MGLTTRDAACLGEEHRPLSEARAAGPELIEQKRSRIAGLAQSYADEKVATRESSEAYGLLEDARRSVYPAATVTATMDRLLDELQSLGATQDEI